MKAWAVVAHDRPLACVEVPDLQPRRTDVVVRVTHCGVCHSDLHLWHGGYDLGGGRMLRVADRGLTLPAAPGHEIVGRVARIGEEVEGVAVGETVLVYPWIGCGRCRRCARGEDNLCLHQRSLGVSVNGGFADEVLVPHPRYLFRFDPIPPGLAATYACSGLTAYAAAKKARPENPYDLVVIIGAGGLGLAAISILHALGHRAIACVDLDPAKLEAARAAGADHVVRGDADDVAQALRTAVDGPVEAVIDFVGSTRTAALGHAVLTKGGTLVLVGVGGGELTVSVAGSIFRAVNVLGSLTGSLGEMQEVIDLARAGSLRPTPIREHPFAQTNAVLAALAAGAVIGRAVLVHDAAQDRAGSGA